ncbi:ATP-NAD kinase-like protein [Leptomonas seymouri]|uniref:ATP-NAD kinase-like protein n=1 Tax=Leptomonas seymouri TaxID=5684 RepID=A0A0N1I0T7_LEPSE|nr:ATP-NAD kinase-like protein [Leptomonas seymouri]|eukprot:KPI84505.1 ATP-NAD kinase-like protein [Leptomonas seymouri]
MRRTVAVLCSGGPYHVPPLARVALFPIHLDPPTRQHRELFRLLLGAPDVATSSRSPQTPQAASVGPLGSPTAQEQLCASAGSPVSSAAGLKDGPQSFVQQQGRSSTPSPSGPPTKAGSAFVPRFAKEGPTSSSNGSSFWYMEAFATSLREDSQLTPFDDVILIPNTRGPVSLRQSTHLAALAVLATRGLSHVHVDFTALEHPDESMPIIYELVCKYTNCVLVHWLQDAYEMQNWSYFSEFKNTVPMLLLQTQSYSPRALERQRPLGSVSRLHSRQYLSPTGPYVRSLEEAEYYRNAERFIHASKLMRRHNPAPMALTGGDDYMTMVMRERYESTSLVNRESDYFDDVPDAPPNHRRAVDDPSSTAAWREDESDVGHRKSLTRSPLLCGDQTATRTTSINTLEPLSSNSGAVQRPSAGHDQLGLNYADCARGRWWNTPGGRGDDEVELSRAYWSSTSSSWLDGGSTAAASSLPELMEEVGAAAKAKAKGHRHSTEDHASTANTPDTTPAGETEEHLQDGGATAAASERDYAEQRLDTVVSDDGFALAVDWQAGGPADVEAAALPLAGSASKSEQYGKAPLEVARQAKGFMTDESAARESADEDTRNLYLTREIEDVSKMLDGMLRHPGATSATSASGAATEIAKLGPSSSQRDAAATTSLSSTGASNAAKSTQTLGQTFVAYAAQHHQAPSHPRRRHRTVRQLIEELLPPRSCGAATAASAGSTAIGAAEDGIREYYGVSPSAASSTSGSGRGAGQSRAVSAASIFNTAVKTTPTHLGLMRQGAMNCVEGEGSGISPSTTPVATTNGGANGNSDLYSWIDSPMVEVHTITRSTGADVRQALWEQEIHPSSILMDCVQRYIEGHGLYRDPRKATAASLYAGVGAGDFSGSARGGSGGQLGAAAEASGGFRDSVTAGSGSAGSNAMGNTILDGRLGARRVVPRDTSTLSFPGLIPRLELHYDHNNLLAREQFEKLRIFQCQDGEEPDLIVPIGGDGYMMHCIRKNWRRFIPFYGVNAGHVGYLLNDRSTLEELFSYPLKLHFTTMLYCQAEKETDTGERILLSELAFNDAWVERSSGQTALIRILVNGQERIRRLRGDGVLVSTAAGSTAYSQALGASPVPVGAPLIQVVGSNVVSPAQWRPAHLDQEDQVEFEVIDSTKRPCRCYVDSVVVGNVTRLLVRSSRVAGVTLAFSKSCDLQHKLYQVQFPKTL